MSFPMDVVKIQSFIPHRFPFLLVDRVVSISETEIVALKNVTINEPFFQGHFPGAPVMPGVLIVEALAQAAGVFMGHQLELQGQSMADKLMFFMSIDQVKFRQVVAPGDQLMLHVSLVQKRGAIAKFEAKATVDGKVTTEANFMAMLSDKK
ncbi:3-hydroxyacyl-ACP dehydratase FabZ [Candidatus Bodocaedibacter vickermanii]|uniref:3-hydroxyacyl-[acyl-carrier-protein] dehydratase FabZ n=1 Tax=Candidatus Bodocaedibacter vickermanii TaxID=2741701 RepID=A0A7L9RTI8_9PROT|nr:3-hydroxyacyl-[acyl-carrier-protein] dehydratase FabZ [Candidatus Paracaedibacteraceae bacterium 'Lake Konstanz']